MHTTTSTPTPPELQAFTISAMIRTIRTACAGAAENPDLNLTFPDIEKALGPVEAMAENLGAELADQYQNQENDKKA